MRKIVEWVLKNLIRTTTLVQIFLQILLCNEGMFFRPCVNSRYELVKEFCIRNMVNVLFKGH